MRNGVIDEKGNEYLLDAEFSSSLELRDAVSVDIKKGQHVNWCGRAFDVSTVPTLLSGCRT